MEGGWLAVNRKGVGERRVKKKNKTGRNGEHKIDWRQERQKRKEEK